MIHQLTIGDELPTFVFRLEKPLGTVIPAPTSVPFSFIQQSDKEEKWKVVAAATGTPGEYIVTVPAAGLDLSGDFVAGMYLGEITVLVGTDRQTANERIKFRLREGYTS